MSSLFFYVLYMNKQISFFMSSLFLLVIYEQTYQCDFYVFKVCICYISTNIIRVICMSSLFVRFNFLCPINNLLLIKGRVFVS